LRSTPKRRARSTCRAMTLWPRLRVAEKHGVRFIGPNCAGLINTSHRLYPTLETHPPAGSVAVVAQSGAVGGVVMAWAKEFGLGISKFVSYGNGADLNEIDFLRYLADDVETQVVALYIESASGGREFMQAVRECAARKPVVVIKAGRTQSGRRATLSHTGSLAGAAIVTNSGGPGVLATDRAEEVGLDVVEPGPATKEKLAEFLPAHCAFKNPIDLTVEGTEEGYRKTLLALAEEYDALLALNIATPYLDSLALARGVCDAAEQADTPIVAAFLPHQIVSEAVDYLQERSIPNFSTGERAVAALAGMSKFASLQICKPASPNSPIPQFPNLPTLEPQAMVWLRENGVPTPEFRFATDQKEAVRGCREIGYPVVMKVVSPEILHKSDVGGVIVNIGDDQAAMDAFEAIRRGARGTAGAFARSPVRAGGRLWAGWHLYRGLARRLVARSPGQPRRGGANDPRNQILPVARGRPGAGGPRPGCAGRPAGQILPTPLPLSWDRRSGLEPGLFAG